MTSHGHRPCCRRYGRGTGRGDRQGSERPPCIQAAARDLLPAALAFLVVLACFHLACLFMLQCIVTKPKQFEKYRESYRNMQHGKAIQQSLAPSSISLCGMN
jgi:hypothetical protein